MASSARSSTVQPMGRALSTLQDFLELQVPYKTHYARSLDLLDSLERSTFNSDTASGTTQGDSAFCRMPGEKLLRLAAAVEDPTLIDRVTRGLRQGLERSTTGPGRGLYAPIPEMAKHHLERVLGEELPWPVGSAELSLERLGMSISGIVEPIVSELYEEPVRIYPRAPNPTMGQKVEQTRALVEGVTGKVLTTVAIDTATQPMLESFFSPEVIDAERWRPPGSVGNALDMRLAEGRVGRTIRLGGGFAMAFTMMLQIDAAANGRFGLYWAAPYFILTELVEFGGRSYLLVSKVCSSVGARGSSESSTNLFAVLVAIFASFHPSYPIEGPSNNFMLALHDDAADHETNASAVALRPLCALKDTAAPLLKDEEAVIELRHLPGTEIVCDDAMDRDSCMLAIRFFSTRLGEAWDKVPESLAWFDVPVADARRLDRLDLVAPIGRGRTCTVWKAQWSRGAAAVDAPTTLSVGHVAAEVAIVAKVVPAEFASSVAREYFIYTTAVPRLSAAAQALFPEFYGLYRSGWDGGGYILVMEDVGNPVKHEEMYSDSCLGRDARLIHLRCRTSRAAFRLLREEGLYHDDESGDNVACRTDGRIFIIDWGEASFSWHDKFSTPPRRCALSPSDEVAVMSADLAPVQSRFHYGDQVPRNILLREDRSLCLID
ncbi:BZ3500_MvSof-1268-A1-R1_Chr6-3g08715 [Microbotryum saponariae]|uniref:BZ3500_MvSof-1268-A1-R1_Chr6-3g08715 protein n=1 Tax=Microbotryum saponariae TaxID=289078 RepID=A0A2X0NMD7_9BASI|nr:BZ3500_MvSof-1268-A1-R1_Chr6-3g08715 [Microbotryum saponariae]SDA07316.1 BZ3501_MvSof-1269-A2-R1_Chr6-2g08418 [Microbotryum saponariae]